MKSSLRILISGESSFAERLKEELAGINREYAVNIAESGEKVISAVSKEDYNIIIPEFALPDMKGPDLFSKLRHKKPGLSFILVFDKGEEKDVLKALSNGSNFFVQERKSPEILAKELEKKIRDILEPGEETEEEPGEDTRTCEPDIYSEACFRETPNGILVFDKKGRFKIANPTACRMTGYSEDELRKMSIPDMHALAPESEKEEISKFYDLLDKGRLESEFLFKRKDGSRIFMEINAVKIAPGEYISFINDITEKKEFLNALKESEDRYRSLFNGVPDYILVHRGGKILYVNPPVSGILGIPVKEVIGSDMMDYVAPESRKEVIKNMKKRAKGDQIPPYEIIINTKTGPRKTEVHGSMIRYEGETASIIVLTDITERKEAEEALQKSREQYKSLVENIRDIIYTLDSSGTITYISPVIESYLGIPPEEITGRPFSEFIHPDDLEKVENNFKDTLNGKTGSHTFRVLDSKGRSRYFRSSSRNVEMGVKFSGFTGVLSDFTAEMTAKNELLESEKRFRNMFENSPLAYQSLNDEAKLIDINEEWSKLTGYSKDEVLGTPFMNYVGKDECHDCSTMFSDFIEKGETNTELNLIKKNGETIMVLLSGKIQRDAEGNFVRTHCILKDITELRHEEEYRRLLARMSDDAPASIIVHGFDGKMVYVNEETLHLHGFSRDEFMKMRLQDINVPESRKLLNKKLKEIREKRELEYDVEHLRKDGSIFPMHVNVKIVEWEGREVLLNIATDITERKEAERQLKQNSLFLQQLIDAIPNPVFYKDTKGVYLGCNTAFENYIGTRKDQIVGKSVYDLSPKKLADKYREMDQEIIKNPGIQKYESQVQYADGTLHDVIFYKATYSDINGETGGLVGIILDISDRKKMEEALKENEEKFRSYMDYAREGIIIADPSGRYIEANSAACELFGYTMDELLELSVTDVLLPDDKELHLANFMKIGKKKHLVSEMEILRKDRTAVPVIISAVLLPNGNILGLHTDISNLKHAEDGLKEANRKLNLLSSITRHDILNQLTAIIAFLEMIEMDHEYPSDSKTDEYLEKITGAANTIKRQILFTKDYKDLGEQAPKWQKVSEIVDTTAKNSSFAGLKVENTLGELEIYADPLFGKVIYNLFDNAVKHGEKISKIGFSFEESKRGGILVCEDDGMGVPEEFKEKILNRQHYTNTGLGLFLSGEILSTTGIKLSENGVYGEGARFEMRIPEGMFRFGE